MLSGLSALYRRCAVVVVLQAIVVASLRAGQVGSGEIGGFVTDASGRAVPGANVTVTEVATGRQRHAVTTLEGIYVVPGLPPGEYRLDVTLDGFRPVARLGVQVVTGQKLKMDVEMSVGGVNEEVTVADEIPVLRTTSGSLGTTISRIEVAELPLNGRTFIGLASLAPGVALPPGSQLPRINGGRPRTNEYLFDGISVLQPEPGQIAFFPVIDAIQEFRIESNSPPAEFGRFNGGVANLTTKAGTNMFQGNVFGFVRHDALNARNYFQRANATKPRYRRSQAGGTFGGPIAKNQTFFFIDYQAQRQSIDRPVTSVVPTLLQRDGVFTEAIGTKVPVIYDPATTVGNTRTPFPNNTIPKDRFDPVALALLARYPLPTASGTSNNYRRTDREVDDQDQMDARIDHRFGSGQDHVFGRLSRNHGQFIPVTPLPEGSGVTTGTLGPQDTIAWAFASSWQHTFSTNVFNEVRIGDTRRAVDRSATAQWTAGGSGIGLPGIPTDARFPTTLPLFAISGYQQLGSPINTASQFRTGVREIADSLTWLRGRHAFKMGFDFRWERLNVIQPPAPTGSFTFNAFGSNLPGDTTNTGTPLASFLLGQVQSFSIDLQKAEIQERARFQEYFIQDEWRLSRRFTLNPGLRYTLNFPSTEIKGQTAVFNRDTRLLEYPGEEPVRPLKKDNFGPRVSGVYMLNDATIASAGYGLVWIEMAGITTPFTTPTFPFIQTVSQRSLDTTNPAFLLRNGPTIVPVDPTPAAGLGQGVFAVNSGLGSGYVQQWNVSLQRSLTPTTTLEIAYVGSKITNVGIPDGNINQLTVDQLATGPHLLDKVQNPYFGIIPRSSSLGDPTITVAQLMKPFPEYTTVSIYRNNVGTTRYDGFEIGVRRRLSRGLSYSAAYTRSKLVDVASSVFDASILTGPVANYPLADSYDLGRERDYSTGDIPHAFVSSVVWDLPFGEGRAWSPGGVVGEIVKDWGLTAIVTLQSGVPVAITQATNNNAFAGFGVQRPTLVGNPELPAGERNADHWFNTAAFEATPQFKLGTSSRNPVRGPSYRNVDLALMRRVPMAGRTSLELRAEIFNLLNTVQLGTPVAVQGAANFGTIITAFDPRVLQIAVKVAF